MKLLSAACSDRGIKKKINQDSLLVRSAMTKEGEILLAAVCDGMGGLEKGEVASGEVIRALVRWFEETLPLLLSGEQRKREWEKGEKERLRKVWKA
ncbi:MAG: PP2C family protein-serine/threonine phosphatase [Faecalimonas umbilicata]